MRKYLIALDDGHGMTTAGKRTPSIPELGGRVIHENEFNREVVKYLDIELKRCGFNTLLVAPTDADTSLSTRTNLANSKNADAYISIHYNAFDGKFDAYDPEGLSVHIYPKSVSGRKLAECVLKYLKEGTAQKNRGIVENNFHVLRETKMVAILSENGFMDNKHEAMLMLDVDFQKEVAREHAKGICDYFGVKYVEEPTSEPTGILYRVQVGAFSKKANAEVMLKKIKAAGFDAFITTNGTPEKSEPTKPVEVVKEIKTGSKVKIKNAVTYDGKRFIAYHDVYDVIQVSGDRIVIGIGKTITAAVHKDNLIIQ